MRIYLKVLALILICTFVVGQNIIPEQLEEDLFQKFQTFMQEFQKSYENIDLFLQRFNVFKQNYLSAMIVMNNTLSDDLSMGVTQFMDMTPDEFQNNFLNNNIMNITDLNGTIPFFNETDNSQDNSPNTDIPSGNGLVIPVANWTTNFPLDNSTDSSLNFLNGDTIPSDPSAPSAASDPSTPSATSDPLSPVGSRKKRMLQYLPQNFDWRSYGVVTSVKNQGSCGACWAFTAAANIEGQYAIKYRKSISLSVQQMLDCSTNDSGCNGGIMDSAYNYLIRAGGIVSYNSYPFLGYQGYCRFNKNSVVARLTGYTSAGSTDENVIMAYLYRTGPLSVTMNASTLQYYQGGVFKVGYNYCPYGPNHGVTIVGYGTTTTGINYWTAKNSWGPNWGEAGYFRIARGNGLCGINQYVISATIA